MDNNCVETPSLIESLNWVNILFFKMSAVLDLTLKEYFYS